MSTPSLNLIADSDAVETLEAAAYRKVGWRLVPLLVLCYTVSLHYLGSF